MSDNIITLHKSYPAQDVVQGLRNIADEIENSGDPVATCVVCIGSTAERQAGEDRIVSESWSTFAVGQKTDGFTVRGLLLSCAMNLAGADA